MHIPVIALAPLLLLVLALVLVLVLLIVLAARRRPDRSPRRLREPVAWGIKGAMENTICFFELPADDLEAAGAFYRELFNWNITESPGSGYLFVSTSKEHPDALGGGIAPRAGTGHSPTVFVTVESVDAAVEKAAALGAKILVPKSPLPKLGWTATVRDPQGNTVGLFEVDEEAS